jgi:outer membrane protein assembly factor BamA
LLREKISDKLTLHASFIQSPEFKLGSNNTQTISTFSTSANSTLDQISVDLASLDLEKTEITVTQKQTFGLGIGQDTKWFFGAEYMKSNGGGLKNQLFNLNNVDYKNGSRISIGGFYIPEFDSFTNYFNTIVYRLGIRIEKTGLYIQDQSIDEIGFNFGLGLPFQGFSNVNLGFEIGKRGSQNKGLLEENFFSVRLGMSLSDLWFVKNKYN